MHGEKHQSYNYDEIDRVLDMVEPLLFSLAGEKRLIGAQIERWRWDEPAVTLTWTDRGPGKLQRNIRLIVEGEPPKHYRILVEANAWIDEEVPETGGRRRRWNREVFDKEGSAENAMLLVENAYGRVSNWDVKDLTFTHRLIA